MWTNEYCRMRVEFRKDGGHANVRRKVDGKMMMFTGCAHWTKEEEACLLPKLMVIRWLGRDSGIQEAHIFVDDHQRNDDTMNNNKHTTQTLYWMETINNNKHFIVIQLRRDFVVESACFTRDMVVMVGVLYFSFGKSNTRRLTWRVYCIVHKTLSIKCGCFFLSLYS